jgi:hypothetical protein
LFEAQHGASEAAKGMPPGECGPVVGFWSGAHARSR